MADTSASRVVENMNKGHDTIGDRFVDVMTGGNGDLDDNVKTKYEYMDRVAQIKTDVAVDSGNMTAEEAEAYLSEMLSDNERNRSSELRGAYASQGVSIGVNMLSLVLGGKGGANVADDIIRTKAASELANTAVKVAAGTSAELTDDAVRILAGSVSKDVVSTAIGSMDDDVLKLLSRQILEELGDSADDVLRQSLQQGTKAGLTSAIGDLSDDVLRAAIKNSPDDISRMIIQKAGRTSMEEAIGHVSNSELKKILMDSTNEGLHKLGKNVAVYDEGIRASLHNITSKGPVGAVTKLLETPGRIGGHISHFVGAKIGNEGAKGLRRVLSVMATKQGMTVSGAATSFAVSYGITNAVMDRTNDNVKQHIGELDTLVRYYAESDDEILIGKDSDALAIAESYAAGVGSLEEAYSAGLISEEEYADQLESLVEDNVASLDASDSKWREYGAYVLNEGGAREVAEYDIKNHYDPDNSEKNYVRPLYDDNPNIARTVQDALVLNPYGACTNEFTSFLASVNATIVKYCPFVASIEATLLKAMDSTWDILHDAVTGKDNISKYQNQSITDIADNIKSFSAEHLAKKEEYVELANSVANTQSAESFEDKEDIQEQVDNDIQETAESDRQMI